MHTSSSTPSSSANFPRQFRASITLSRVNFSRGIDSTHWWEACAERGPWFFGGLVHNPGFSRICGRKDCQEDQLLWKRIISAMYFAHGNEGHFARFQDSMFFADPLLSLAGNDEDQFFARGMIVEWMGAKRLHVSAHQEQLLVLYHVRTAEPFLQSPGRLKLDCVRGSDETAERNWVLGFRIFHLAENYFRVLR